MDQNGTVDMFGDPDYPVIRPVLEQYGWERGFYQQHYEDAYNAEFAGSDTKPITLAFALVGLCLAVECGLDGRGVQQAHAVLARRKDALPILDPGHADVTFGLRDVAAEPTADSIHAWCTSVWAAFADQHDVVRNFVTAGSAARPIAKRGQAPAGRAAGHGL